MEHMAHGESPDVYAIADAIDALDEKIRKRFAQLADVTSEKDNTLCGLELMADGWGISLEEARATADVLVANGCLQFEKELSGVPYYSIPRAALIYGISLINPNSDESFSS